jgi:hypothetical protein
MDCIFVLQAKDFPCDPALQARDVLRIQAEVKAVFQGMFEDFVWEPLFWHGVSSFLKAIGKAKRPPGPSSAREGV